MGRVAGAETWLTTSEPIPEPDKKWGLGGRGGGSEAATVSGNIKVMLVKHGKALTDEVIQKTSSHKAQH